MRSTYDLAQIAQITGSRVAGRSSRRVSIYLNDSRALQSAEDTLFIALRTARNDGHHYVPDLIEQGVTSFLVAEGAIDLSLYTGAEVSFLVHSDPLEAIQQFAAWHRRRFDIPVIGITGSNGKTMVKEWLYQMLKKKYTICRSPKSYNSQIGVPLSVLNLNETHDLAIFEAGISHRGEMQKLEAIIQPNLGILTSIGAAHDEGFGSRTEKVNEKLKLFANCRQVIVNGLSAQELPDALRSRSMLISTEQEADVWVQSSGNKLTLQTAGNIHHFEIPFSDEASVRNAATCAVTMLALDQPASRIAEGLSQLHPVALRLETKNGINNCLVINDYYNSDLDSIRIALNYLDQQSRKSRQIVIISDVEQSGLSPGVLYKQLADLFSRQKIGLVIGIGREISEHRPLFKAGSLFFPDTVAFVRQFASIGHHLSEATILLKGARSFGFEAISRLLQLKSHDTVFEINLSHLTDNINYYRSLLRPSTRIMCMVKAAGYGSGSSGIAKTLQHIGADYLAVAYADEGVELRQARVTLPVMVMSPEEDAFDDLITYNLEPELYNLRVLRSFAERLDALGVSVAWPVHIKIDTGMHRLGFSIEDLSALCEELKRLPRLKVRSVFSHLAGSDNPQLDAFSAEQIRLFEMACSAIGAVLDYSFLKHISNSAAIARFPQAHYDMVRIGIGMYGIGADEAEQTKLKNVCALKTRISQIRIVPAGDTVSYNRSGKIEKETRIATLPLGYADGFNRALGNGKHGVYIQGQFCPTVGNVCMDMIMVDVTAVGCREGDEVIIFGSAEHIWKTANVLNTIPYEVLTNVSSRVKRVYVQE